MELNFLNKMIVKKIKIGKDEESKRKAILDNLGEQVILHDVHERMVHGRLLKEGYDDKCYQMYIADSRRERELWYHGLQKLLLLRAHRDNPLPEIKIE